MKPRTNKKVAIADLQLAKGWLDRARGSACEGADLFGTGPLNPQFAIGAAKAAINSALSHLGVEVPQS